MPTPEEPAPDAPASGAPGPDAAGPSAAPAAPDPDAAAPVDLPTALRFPGAVWPDYRGGGIVNLPATIGGLLGVEDGWAAPPLAPRYGLRGERFRRVLLLLLDGVGWNRLRRHLDRSPDDAAFWRNGRLLAPLTSVSPATTSVATTVLMGNGAAPAEQGVLGFSQRLPDRGLVANMLFWRPQFQPQAANGSLEAWGLAPEAFLPTPSVFQVLAAGGVAGASFLPTAIARSPLSRMQMRGAPPTPCYNPVDLLHNLGEWLAATERGYAYAYLSDFDSLSHRDGPDGPVWAPLFGELTRTLRRWLRALPAASRRGTLLLVSADHGHAFVPPAERVFLEEHPELTALCSLREAGEPRHLLLHARAGALDELAARVAERFGERAAVLAGAEALASGLYGPPERAHPEALARLGDVVVLARGGHTFWSEAPADGAALPLGMHGALDADEMRVPLAAFDLGAMEE